MGASDSAAQMKLVDPQAGLAFDLEGAKDLPKIHAAG